MRALKLIFVFLSLACASISLATDDYTREGIPLTGQMTLKAGEVICFSYNYAEVKTNGGQLIDEKDRFRCREPDSNGSISYEIASFTLETARERNFYVSNIETEKKRIEDEYAFFLIASTTLLFFPLLGLILFSSTGNGLYFIFSLMTIGNLAVVLFSFVPPELLGIKSPYVVQTLWLSAMNLSSIFDGWFVLILLRRLLLLGGHREKLVKRTIFAGQCIMVLLAIGTVFVYHSPWDSLITSAVINWYVTGIRNMMSLVMVGSLVLIILTFKKGGSLVPLYLLPSYIAIMTGGGLLIASFSIIPRPSWGVIAFVTANACQGLLFFLAIGRSILEKDRAQTKELATWASELEHRVKARTAELESILNSSEAAILQFNKNSEISAANRRALALFPVQKNIEEVLTDLRVSGSEKESIKAVFGGVDRLNWEINEGHFPSKCSYKDRQNIMAWGVIDIADEVAGVTLTMSDVTDSVLAEEKAKKHNRDASLMYSLAQLPQSARKRLIKDIENLRQGLREGSHKMQAHTLKGNALSLGLKNLGDLIHQWEGGEGSGEEVFEEMDRIEQMVNLLFGGAGNLHLDESEAISALKNGSAREFLQNHIFQTLESVVLGNPSVINAPKLAERLGKSEPEIRIVSDGQRLLPEATDAFGIFLTHAVRNSMDHGIESPEVRQMKGKPEKPFISIEASSSDKGVTIRVKDDGAGLNVSALRKKFGDLPLDSLAEKIFESGVSTKTEVTDVSGRGVGVGAGKEAIEAIGGNVSLELGAEADFVPMTFVIFIPSDKII